MGMDPTVWEWTLQYGNGPYSMGKHKAKAKPSTNNTKIGSVRLYLPTLPWCLLMVNVGKTTYGSGVTPKPLEEHLFWVHGKELNKHTYNLYILYRFIYCDISNIIVGNVSYDDLKLEDVCLSLRNFGSFNDSTHREGGARKSPPHLGAVERPRRAHREMLKKRLWCCGQMQFSLVLVHTHIIHERYIYHYLATWVFPKIGVPPNHPF